MQIFHDGALQAFTAFDHFVDFDPSQAFGTINFDKFGVAVDLTAAHLGATWHTQCHHAPARGGGWRAENFEVHIAPHIGQLSEF